MSRKCTTSVRPRGSARSGQEARRSCRYNCTRPIHRTTEGPHHIGCDRQPPRPRRRWRRPTTVAPRPSRRRRLDVTRRRARWLPLKGMAVATAAAPDHGGGRGRSHQQGRCVNEPWGLRTAQKEKLCPMRLLMPMPPMWGVPQGRRRHSSAVAGGALPRQSWAATPLKTLSSFVTAAMRSRTCDDHLDSRDGLRGTGTTSACPQPSHCDFSSASPSAVAPVNASAAAATTADASAAQYLMRPPRQTPLRRLQVHLLACRSDVRPRMPPQPSSAPPEPI